MLHGSILITGGTGTLGKAIVKRTAEEKWDCTLTIYSRDPVKQQIMRRVYPQCRYVLGDVRDEKTLTHIAYGHDLILHAAAQKHIPDAERNPVDCYQTNVEGSLNILRAAAQAGVKQILAISTDKACHPVNTYGATKLMMERAWQQFALSEMGREIKVNLCRYGNVINSTGSVIPAWQSLHDRAKPLLLTHPGMTRFWMTIDQAVGFILEALDEPSGTIYVPTLPALTMLDLVGYLFPEDRLEMIGLRPGEKMHEELLSEEESIYADACPGQRTGVVGTCLGYYRLWPVTGEARTDKRQSYSSYTAPEISLDSLLEMAGR